MISGKLKLDEIIGALMMGNKYQEHGYIEQQSKVKTTIIKLLPLSKR